MDLRKRSIHLHVIVHLLQNRLFDAVALCDDHQGFVAAGFGCEVKHGDQCFQRISPRWVQPAMWEDYDDAVQMCDFFSDRLLYDLAHLFVRHRGVTEPLSVNQIVHPSVDVVFLRRNRGGVKVDVLCLRCRQHGSSRQVRAQQKVISLDLPAPVGPTKTTFSTRSPELYLELEKSRLMLYVIAVGEKNDMSLSRCTSSVGLKSFSLWSPLV